MAADGAALKAPSSRPQAADQVALSSPWSALARFALAGATAVFVAVASIALGSVIADWLITHLGFAKSHPAVSALAATTFIAAVLVRSLPWRFLWGFGGDVESQDPAPPDARVATPTAASRIDGLGRWQWGLCVLASAVIVVVLLHRQVFPHLGSKTMGGEGDREWYTFLAWKIGDAFRQGTSPFHLSGIVSPHGFNILLSDGFLPPLLGGVINLLVSPFTTADSGAVLSYNVMLMLSTGLSFWSGTYLAGQITTRRVVKLLVGLALATAPVIYFRFLGHLSASFNFPVALVTAEAIHIARRGAPVRWIRLSAFLLIAFGCTAYYFIIAAGLVVVATIWRCVGDRVDARNVVRGVVMTFLVVGVVLLPLLIQRSNFTSAELAAGSQFRSALRVDAEAYNADVLSVALPTFRTALNWPGTERLERKIVVGSREGNSSFPGLVLLVLGVGGLVVGHRREFGPILFCALVVWIATLGPVADVLGIATLQGPPGAARVHWMPFEVLKNVPVLSSLRAPGRLSLGLPALLAAGCAYALDSIFARSRPVPTGSRFGHAALTGIVLLAMVPNIPTFTPTPLAFAQPVRALLSSLDDQPGHIGRVLPVPSCVGVTSGTEAIENLWTDLPTVGCQGQYLALPFASEMQDYVTSADLAALRCSSEYIGYVATSFPPNFREISPDLTALRTDFGVRFLVVDATTAAQCVGLPELIATLAQTYLVLPGDHRWSVIDLGRRRI